MHFFTGCQSRVANSLGKQKLNCNLPVGVIPSMLWKASPAHFHTLSLWRTGHSFPRILAALCSQGIRQRTRECTLQRLVSGSVSSFPWAQTRHDSCHFKVILMPQWPNPDLACGTAPPGAGEPLLLQVHSPLLASCLSVEAESGPHGICKSLKNSSHIPMMAMRIPALLAWP